MQQIPRLLLQQEIQQRLRKSPVVAMLSARQVGKTTLARQVAAEWDGPVTLFDLETAGDQASLETSPELVLSRIEGLVIIDEVQRLPPLFERLRPLCDSPDRQAIFLLVGSASWDLVRGVSESLAGRVQFVDVAGFSMQETGSRSDCGFVAAIPGPIVRRPTRMRMIGWNRFGEPTSSAIFRGSGQKCRPAPWGVSGPCWLTTMVRFGTPLGSASRWTRIPGR